MSRFVGRSRELQSLTRELDRVRSAPSGAVPGRCVLVRGRRRVGKSRLIETFCAAAEVPYVFFTASQRGAREPELFTEEVARSDVAGKELLVDATPQNWDAALRLLAAALDDVSPTIVVIDEFPYLATGDPSVEATFQKQWDRLLSKKPVLLVIIGSDLAMMEALNTHGHAFFQRGTEMVVPPLSPPETGTIVGTDGASEAFDAYLITGGLPLICDEWTTGVTMWAYLEDALFEPTSALIVSAERALAAEFPEEAQARLVLGQIGAGEMTFSNIARATGGLQATSLKRSLDVLTAKRIVARETPLSTKPSKDARYRVVDPYLRFWLNFIGPHLAEIERGRSDRVIDRIRRNWTTWRGRVIEPIVREALTRLSPVLGLPAADAVGGFWTRTNVPEVDIIGADRSPVARSIAYAGTIKWLDSTPLDQTDLNQLAADVLKVPGASPASPLVAVSRAGVTAAGATSLGPDDLIAAW
ncbi:MAG: ATP-binding protein [Acidimicrobiia bacterium]